MILSKPVRDRLYSLDALRGFDMFWIIGGEDIVHSLSKVTGSSFWGAFAVQLNHPEWNGFHMYDLIFPLFIFISGVATPYSVGRELEKGRSKQSLLLRVIKRGLLLVLLGVAYNNGLELRPLSEIRFGSVLGRIGLAYLFANVIYLYTNERARVIWFAGILLGYWLLLSLTSAPGFPRGDLTLNGNFASYFDRLFLPGKLYMGIHDPEGLLSTVPAICNALLGIITGNFLKNSARTPDAKALRLLVAGAAMLALAQVWNFVFPINKNLWTSSFVLQTGGLSLMFLSAFYYIIDVKKYVRWAFFFTVIGMNAILIYISEKFINWEDITHSFFQWLLQLSGKPLDLVVFACCFVAVKWFLLYFLYRKKIFLRV